MGNISSTSCISPYSGILKKAYRLKIELESNGMEGRTR